MNTVDAVRTVERLIGSFGSSEQVLIRERFAKMFRYIVSQRLIPSANVLRRVPVVELLTPSNETRRCIASSDNLGVDLLNAIKEGEAQGMQHFDGEILRLVHSEVLEFEPAMANATDPQEFLNKFPRKIPANSSQLKHVFFFRRQVGHGRRAFQLVPCKLPTLNCPLYCLEQHHRKQLAGKQIAVAIPG